MQKNLTMNNNLLMTLVNDNTQLGFWEVSRFYAGNVRPIILRTLTVKERRNGLRRVKIALVTQVEVVPSGNFRMGNLRLLHSPYTAEACARNGLEHRLVTRGACGPTSLKMGSFRRPVAILQTITRFCNHPDRLCETCSNSCALVAILSLAYLVLVRVLTCLLSTKKIRNVAGKCLYIN